MFFQGLIRDLYTHVENDFDFFQYGLNSFDLARTPWKNRLKEKILLSAGRIGFVHKRLAYEHVSFDSLSYIVRNLDELTKFYNILADDRSRQLLLKLLNFRILGRWHVKLPIDNEDYWDLYKSVNKRFLQERDTIGVNYANRPMADWPINRYRLPGSEGKIDVHATSLGVMNTFLLEQYAYKQGSTMIRAQRNDVIIDAGGGWGDTALYFANQCGQQGKVYCFEIDSSNLAILERNLALNRYLADRILVERKALWEKSGRTLSFKPYGPATSLYSSPPHGLTPSLQSEDSGSVHVPTISLDDFVQERGIQKVDYIKMDIESSELAALHGAEKTLCTFRPKLAIALYHREDDFIAIPRYLKELGLDYQFFLDHFSIYGAETMLFATTKMG